MTIRCETCKADKKSKLAGDIVDGAHDLMGKVHLLDCGHFERVYFVKEPRKINVNETLIMIAFFLLLFAFAFGICKMGLV